MHQHQRQHAHSIVGSIICGIGYGEVVRRRGHEDYGPHRLPFVEFAGGTRIAVYCLPSPSGWRSVYTSKETIT